MASVGLYDLDFMTYIHVPFNLELMKISAYYKSRYFLTSFSPTLEPEKYGKFIVRKDYNDGNFPNILYKEKNVEYGGYAFTGGIYIPLDPKIESMSPDTELYRKYEKKFCINKEKSKIFKIMLGATHIRLSLDNKTIQEKWDKNVIMLNRPQSFFFHDYDLNQIDGAYDLITELGKKSKSLPNFIGCKFPIQLYNSQDLLNWSNIYVLSNNFSISYFGLIEDQAFEEFVIKQKNKTNVSRQLEYYITDGCKDENDFVIHRLPKIYNQAIFLRNNKVIMPLKYRNHFFVDKRWERLIELINAFVLNIHQVPVNNSFLMWRAMETESLFSFCKSFGIDKHWYKTFDIEEVKDIFNLVKEKNYDLFTDFYNKSKVELKGGQFINASIRYS